jgi:hypothetical protein
MISANSVLVTDVLEELQKVYKEEQEKDIEIFEDKMQELVSLFLELKSNNGDVDILRSSIEEVGTDYRVRVGKLLSEIYNKDTLENVNVDKFISELAEVESRYRGDPELRVPTAEDAAIYVNSLVVMYMDLTGLKHTYEEYELFFSNLTFNDFKWFLKDFSDENTNIDYNYSFRQLLRGY